jgi:hypothetical protein
MTILGRSISTSALTWLGLLGAPLAWVGQFLVGFGAALAACGAGGRQWGIPVDGWTLAATVVATVVGIAGELAAVAAFRATREARGAGGADEAPPLGRVHFLATVGMTTTPLFLFIILLSGLGSVALPNCHQS